MFKKISFTISLITLSLLVFGQENFEIFNGVVTDKNKIPIDVFSVVVFNVKDSTKQLYANTFSNGNFNLNFTPNLDEKYGVYLLSMGYKDTKLSLDKMRDTIVMANNSIKIQDVTVQGKRKVTTSIGIDGGVLFDISNTYLSDLGESTQLLNFIPGIKADKDGNISLMGIAGDVVIYINNIKQDDPEKFKTLKSKDIKSIEVLRSPGAKYKDAAAVILINTNRSLNGFSTNIGMSAYMSDNKQYSISPDINLAYTKGHITTSIAYGYNTGESLFNNNITRKINENLLPDKWTIYDQMNNRDKNNQSHWYKANLTYTINEKNILTFQYRGRYDTYDRETKTTQDVSVEKTGSIYKNILYKLSDNNNLKNTAHIYYKGEYSSKFNLEFNADYSNKSLDNSISNRWISEEESSSTLFTQPLTQKADAFTTEVLLSNTIASKHIISYGAEYAYIKDDMRSTDMDGTPTLYKQYSHFVKGIIEYKTQIMKSLGLYLGTNYMYSKVIDNNNLSSRHEYNTIIPYLSLQYYNPNKKYNISLNIKYNYIQPAAGLLDETTVSYISPYEIKTGNRDLKNSQNIKTSLSFNYKNVQLGIENEYHINFIFDDAEIVRIQENGNPLIVNMSKNLEKPGVGTNLYVGYSNKFGFWMPSIYASIAHSYGNVPQTNNIYTSLNGWRGFFSLNNHFELPKKFHIYLNGYYGTKGYSIFLYQKGYYSIDFYAEKRFLKDQLRIAVDLKGVVANKYSGGHYTLYDITNAYNSYNGWYRHIGVSVTWIFNNHKKIQQAKDNEYLNML